MSNGIPIGDLQIYDNYVPGLEAGNWWITLNHTLLDEHGKAVNDKPIGAVQELVVSAPQFAIDPAEVLSSYPPPTSTGEFGDMLPHVVLAEPLIPWERKLDDSDPRRPWLALLVLAPEEIVGGDSTPTRATAATVADFLALTGSVLAPGVEREDDTPADSPCTYIQLSTDTFTAVAPRANELRYLTHCRQANTGDKVVPGLNEKGLVSLVVGNRFPPVSDSGPKKCIVHLVSLERMADYLVDEPDYGTATTVALASLWSWTFETLSHGPADFRQLMTAMVASETDPKTGKVDAGRMWLRVPPTTDTTGAAGEVAKRTRDGYAPVAYQTRSGESTFAWYRGPLTPLVPTPPSVDRPFPTADAALAYDSVYGVFDVSLAAAWQAGRALALADRRFGQQLLDLRRRAHAVTDALHQKLVSEHFSDAQVDALNDTSIHDELLKMLDAQLLQTAAQPQPAAAEAVAVGLALPPDPKTAIQQFLTDPDVQNTLLGIVQDDLDAVGAWLARLLLLNGVPFHYLMPHELMLPTESLRFFHVDQTWLGALLDGATSLGTESSKTTFYARLMESAVEDAAYEAAADYRQSVVGAPSTGKGDARAMSGILMRSAIVAGWPSLAVRARDAHGALVKTLRMDHLSPNVLLCLFSGVPSSIEICEPQESFPFGVDDDGEVSPRNLGAHTELELGAQIKGAPAIAVYDAKGVQQQFTRAVGSRTLHIDPDASDGLIQKLESACGTSPLGPADFAIQMVASPESAIFAPPS